MIAIDYWRVLKRSLQHWPLFYLMTSASCQSWDISQTWHVAKYVALYTALMMFYIVIISSICIWGFSVLEISIILLQSRISYKLIPIFFYLTRCIMCTVYQIRCYRSILKIPNIWVRLMSVLFLWVTVSSPNKRSLQGTIFRWDLSPKALQYQSSWGDQLRMWTPGPAESELAWASQGGPLK